MVLSLGWSGPTKSDGMCDIHAEHLLSIPIIASAGLLKVSESMTRDASVDWLTMGVGVAVSGISAYACIAAFLRLLDKVGFMPFVYYRIALAAALYLLWLL